MEFGKKPITLFKAISLALIAANLMTLFMIWLGGAERGLSAGLSIFSTAYLGMYSSFWSVMLIINAILIILLTGLAVYGLLKDKNSLVLPLAVIGFITFFLAVFQKAFIGESDLHVGVGAWLMLFLSALAFVAALLDNLAAGKPAVALEDFGIRAISFSVTGTSSWICPGCGAKQSAAKNFCEICGTRKPEPPHCPNCGKVARPGEVFCSNCGTKI